jgi:ABC-2 type transport system ATP-binding protein
MISGRDGCTVLISTHIVSDLERIAEHVGIMDRGRIVNSSRLDELQSTTKKVQIVFDADCPPPGFTVPGALWTQVAGPVVTSVARLANEAQLDEIREIQGARVQVFSMGLEDIFVELFRDLRTTAREEKKEAQLA